MTSMCHSLRMPLLAVCWLAARLWFAPSAQGSSHLQHKQEHLRILESIQFYFC